MGANGASNGVVRIGRKGLKKFAFGDGEPFEVDVVEEFQRWASIDDTFRQEKDDGTRYIPKEIVPEFHRAAVAFAEGLANKTKTPVDEQTDVTIAEALDFIARLREEYDDLADFFLPRSREERASPATSEGQSRLQFSEEGS